MILKNPCMINIHRLQKNILSIKWIFFNQISICFGCCKQTKHYGSPIICFSEGNLNNNLHFWSFTESESQSLRDAIPNMIQACDINTTDIKTCKNARSYSIYYIYQKIIKIQIFQFGNK